MNGKVCDKNQKDSYIRRLCHNISGDRFNWRRYCTPQSYFGTVICVMPLHCSYGQIGYTVSFPYRRDMPEVEFDWELNRLTLDDMDWRKYFEMPAE